MNIGQALIRVSKQLLAEFEPEHLYNRIVRIALDELRADCILLMLWNEDSDRIDVAAAAGQTCAVPDALAESPYGSIAEWVLRQRTPLLLSAEDDIPADLRDRLPDDFDLSGLCVPLIAHKRVLGALLAERAATAIPFTAADLDLGMLLASEIAIVIEAARRHSLAQRRADWLAKISSLGLALAGLLDLDQVLHATSAHLSAALPIAHGYLFLRHSQEPWNVQQYPFGDSPPPPLNPLDLGFASGLVGLVLSDGVPRLVHGPDRGDLLDPWERRLLDDADRTLICVELTTDNDIRGALVVAGRTGARLGEEELQFLVSVATPIALAIEKAYQHAMVARSEARYRTLIDHAKDAVLLIDAESMRIVEVNPAAEALSGYDRHELGLLMPSSLISIDPPGSHMLEIADIVARGRTEFEAHVQTRDGRDVPVWIGVSEVPHAGSRYLLLFARDISERQRRAQRLVQTEKLAGMGRLATSIAHEINNPLQAIHNSLHLVLNRPLAEEKRERYLSMAYEEVERMSAIVQRMLDFYRPSRDGMRPISLHAVLESVFAMVGEQFETSGIQVERDWDPHLPWVKGIGSHLRQVFLNLALNAIEAMPTGGRLTIRTRVEEGRPGLSERFVLAEFIDTGPGIPADEAQTIFEPFYTTKNKGPGLGLAISYTIVERHEGTLSVSSNPSGTTFRVALPAIEEEEFAPGEQTSRRGASSMGR